LKAFQKGRERTTFTAEEGKKFSFSEGKKGKKRGRGCCFVVGCKIGQKERGGRLCVIGRAGKKKIKRKGKGGRGK